MTASKDNFGPDIFSEHITTPDGQLHADVVKDEYLTAGNSTNEPIHPEAKEKFLHDVTAVMRGEKSPGLHHDQAQVQAEAKKRLAGHPKASKGISVAKSDLQAAKAQAANLHKTS